MILPGFKISGVAGNPTGGRVKVELAGVPSYPDLARLGTVSNRLVAIDLLSTPIAVCSGGWVLHAPAPTVEVLITLGVVMAEVRDKLREGRKVLAVTLRLVGVPELTVAACDSTVTGVSTLGSACTLLVLRVSSGSSVISDVWELVRVSSKTVVSALPLLVVTTGVSVRRAPSALAVR